MDELNENENEKELDYLDYSDSIDSRFRYMNEIGRMPMLTNLETLALLSKYKEAKQEEEKEEIRNRLIEGNLRLVVAIAKQFEKDPDRLQDLIAEGVLGLNRAITKFEPERGFMFSTYATAWIKQFVLRYKQNNLTSMRLPVNCIEKLNRVIRLSDEIYKKEGESPSYQRLSEITGIPEERVREVLVKGTIDSLDRNVVSNKEEDDTTLLLFIEDPSVNIEEEVTDSLLYQEIDNSIGEFLNDRELQIIQLRFGFFGNDPMTLDEVGKVLGITRERVRQIEHRALQKLRRNPTFRKKFNQNIA